MTVAVIGEGMAELSRNDAGADLQGWHTGYGGDTLNSAIHLARMGLDTRFISALGTDPLSRGLREAWSEEGLDLSFLLTDLERHAGVYAIETDAHGERSFAYWRSDSAAAAMLDAPGADAALASAASADLLYLSLITLAILPPAGRERLFALCREMRAQGGRIAFDSNYRPWLWESRDEARATVERMGPLVDIALPTLGDEIELFGPQSIEATAQRWRSWGASEVAVKNGETGCLIVSDEGFSFIPPPHAIEAVDSSGAGDAFNAGYLAARLQSGKSPTQAAAAGHALAGWVIQHHGAIPARTADAPYTA